MTEEQSKAILDSMGAYQRAADAMWLLARDLGYKGDSYRAAFDFLREYWKANQDDD